MSGENITADTTGRTGGWYAFQDWDSIWTTGGKIWGLTELNPDNLALCMDTRTASFWLFRCWLAFDLSSISNFVVTSARIKTWIYEVNGVGNVYVMRGYQHDPIVLGDWALQNVDGADATYGYTDINTLTPGGFDYWNLNAAGVSYINTILRDAGTAKFCFRAEADVLNHPPVVHDREVSFFFTQEAGKEPVLELTGYYDKDLILEIAFDQSIFTVSPSWTDVSEYLRQLNVKRGRMHELDRIEAGTAFFLLDNSSGNFWRGNTAGSYYPDVRPLQLIRLQGTFDGTSYKLFYGVIESFVHTWQHEDPAYEPEVEIHCVDCFKSLARAKIIDANPAITSDAASGQKNIYVDNVYGLVVGQSIKIYDDVASEVNTISAISNADLKVTMTNNLAATYTTGNNAKLKKFPQVLSGTRVKDVLLEWGWPTALMDLDAGQSEVIEHTPPTGGTNSLEHIQDVAESENGIFFQEGDGTLNFQDSIARQSSPYDTSQATFKDDGNDSRYASPQISDDEEFIYNQADISGDGIGEQSVLDPDYQDDQGPRAITRSNSQLADEMDALAQCYIFVARYKDSILRPRQFIVKPEVSPVDLYPKAFGFDISTRITVELDSTRNPAELDRDYHIEGIQHDWNARDDFFKTTWQLWEVNQYRVIAINHDGYLENTDGASYQLVHDAANSSVPASNDVGIIEVGQWDIYAGEIWQQSKIERGYMEFDTSGLSGLTVQAGAILVKVWAPSYESDDWNLTLVDPDTVGNPLVDADYGNLETQQTSLGSYPIDSDMVPFTWIAIPLNSSGVSHINTGGITKFGLRSDKDINDDDPGGNYQDWAKLFGKGSFYEPMLFVQLQF
jgi:hypothetical protein